MQHLNEEQRRCFRVAQLGHNLLILGKVGSGKSHLLRYIIEQLNEHKRVAVTASTGMARLQFANGDTLHHWSGYGDGHLDNSTIIGRMNSNAAYKSLKEHMVENDVLIIDEIGLISAKMLESVEQICRAVRDNNKIFGGLQVIAAGSFTQLPPVSSRMDPGEFSFHCKNFSKILPHKIQLNTVFRQKEPDLVDAVNELCMGQPSQKTINLIRSLARPLPAHMNPVYIFGTNFDVCFHNLEELQKLPGQMKTFKSLDEGDRNILKTCTAPHLLPLKINCKVTIIRNLENGLVNGLTATVTVLDDDCVTIKVDCDPFLSHGMGGLSFPLQRYKFLLRDELNHVIGIRIQFPLALGYALTVHKAQGRSILELVVDAYNFWKPGQLGVAVGRAISKDGLQVQNFNMFAATLQHLDCVLEFYVSRGEPLKGNKECCMSTIIDEKLLDTEQVLELNTNLDTELEEMAFRNKNGKRFPYNLQELLDAIKVPEYTEFHREKNALLETVIHDKEFIAFLAYLYNKVVYFVEHYKIPPKGVKCNWCAMMSHIYKFLISSQHIRQCQSAFKVDLITPMQNAICSEIFHHLLTKYTKGSNTHAETGGKKLDPLNLDNELKCTIRYIAGAALHRVADKLKCSVNNKVLHDFEAAKSRFRAVQILNTLRVPQSVIVTESCEPETLAEVIRRQDNRQGLTHVSDECFSFFCKLYSEMDSLQNERSIFEDPKNANSNCIEALVQNAELLQTWFHLFEAKIKPCDCADDSGSDEESDTLSVNSDEDILQFEVEHLLVTDMFHMAVQYFCRVHMSDILNQYKFKIGKKKEGSLRSSLGQAKSKKEAMGKEVQFPCGVCEKACIDTDLNPVADFSESSVGCDGCHKWFHFVCVGLSGKESCLKPGSKIKYFCPNCKECPSENKTHTGKGKGRGKKSKPNKEAVCDTPASTTRSGRVRKAPAKLNL